MLEHYCCMRKETGQRQSGLFYGLLQLKLQNEDIIILIWMNTPLSRFSDTQVMTPMEDSHTWGCPVYILEAKTAQGKMPKWEPRSRLGIYLGNSPCHAGSVALVLNPKTLNISPQYHVVFDDHFSTIPYLQKGSVPPHWEELVTKCSELIKILIKLFK